MQWPFQQSAGDQTEGLTQSPPVWSVHWGLAWYDRSGGSGVWCGFMIEHVHISILCRNWTQLWNWACIWGVIYLLCCDICMHHYCTCCCRVERITWCDRTSLQEPTCPQKKRLSASCTKQLPSQYSSTWIWVCSFHTATQIRELAKMPLGTHHGCHVIVTISASEHLTWSWQSKNQSSWIQLSMVNVSSTWMTCED